MAPSVYFIPTEFLLSDVSAVKGYSKCDRLDPHISVVISYAYEHTRLFFVLWWSHIYYG